MIYQSTVEVLGDAHSFSQHVVKLEMSQGRTTIVQALNAGPAHQAFIESLPTEWRADPEVEIFSRLVYLKQGWYPLGPHFHFDWGGRETADGKPIETIMVLHGGASRTEFILGPLEHYEQQPIGSRTKRRKPDPNRWEEQVRAGLKAGTIRTWHLEPNVLIKFDNRTLHRACPAITEGWRVLIRAIRGLKHDASNPGQFTTCRNGFIPTSEEEQARYQPYQQRNERGSY